MGDRAEQSSLHKGTTAPTSLLIEERLGKVWVKVISVLVGVIIALGGHFISSMDSRLAVTEEKVAFMQHDKVSRAEFREEMSQLRLDMSNNNQDVIARMEMNKRETVDLLKILINREN